MAGPSRRRGAALERAIYDAVLGQLQTVGFAKLTMEGVAAAARTGKAALYRRWSTKESLVVEALRASLPAIPEPDPDAPLRDNLITLLLCLRDGMAIAHGPAFQLVRAESEENTDLLTPAARDQFSTPLRSAIHTALRIAVKRGEARPEAATERIARVGPAMLGHSYLTDGPNLSDDDVIAIIDEVLLPLAILPLP